MDKRVISKIRIAIDIPDKPHKEYLRKWRASMKKAASKMDKGIKKSISGVGDYAQKIAKPNIKNQLEWLNPKYRTKQGHTYEEIINKIIFNIPKSYKKFKDKIDLAFENDAKRFRKEIQDKAYKVALRNSRLLLPFSGYRNKVRGAAPFVARWLTGDKKVKDLIIKSDKVWINTPVLITRPDQIKTFRNKFNSRIRQSGARIVRYNYSPGIISDENQITNELINEFVEDGLMIFESGGLSHVDFVVINGQLFLDVKVSRA